MLGIWVMLASRAAKDSDLDPSFYIIGGIALVIVVVAAAFVTPAKCDICGLPIKRTSYTWTIGGKKQKLCPRCSSRMENKISKSAFKSRFG
jgi:hypothetical protein